MSEVERLRNEYVDAAARANVYRAQYEDSMKPMDYYTVQRAEVEAARTLLAAIDVPQHLREEP